MKKEKKMSFFNYILSPRLYKVYRDGPTQVNIKKKKKQRKKYLWPLHLEGITFLCVIYQ